MIHDPITSLPCVEMGRCRSAHQSLLTEDLGFDVQAMSATFTGCINKKYKKKKRAAKRSRGAT